MLKYIFSLILTGILFSQIAIGQDLILPNMLIGKADFSFLFWDVYKIELYAEDKSLENELALKLIYKRKLYGEKIAERSIDEIKKQNCGDEKNYSTWLNRMKSIFPDVKKGDYLVGHKEKSGITTFYKNKKALGKFEDKNLSKCFFDIWLSPKTSEPELRKELLGE